jgi:hypothetical protein
MIRAMQLDEDDARKIRVVFRASGIETRHSVIDDYGKRDQFTFYENTLALDPFPTTRRRVTLYQQHLSRGRSSPRLRTSSPRASSPSWRPRTTETRTSASSTSGWPRPEGSTTRETEGPPQAPPGTPRPSGGRHVGLPQLGSPGPLAL